MTPWNRPRERSSDMRSPPTPPLLALLASPGHRARARLALRLGTASRVIGPAIHAGGWRELGVLAAGHPGSPALVDTFDRPDRTPVPTGSGAPWNGALSRTPVICYAHPDPARERRLSRAGVTFAAHLRPGVDDDPVSIGAAILRSIDARSVRQLLLRIEEAARPGVAEIVGCALDLATEPSSVSDLAHRTGHTVRTLQRRCIRLGIPSPKSLLSLARIFTVQRLAEWSRQPHGAVAVTLGFSDRANYRRLVRRHFARTPTDLERSGGRDYVADTILKSVGFQGHAKVGDGR